MFWQDGNNKEAHYNTAVLVDQDHNNISLEDGQRLWKCCTWFGTHGKEEVGNVDSEHECV
jgi:hypothetical protein